MSITVINTIESEYSMAASTWEEFEKEYNFKKKFGEAAFKALKMAPFNKTNHEHATKMINFVNDPNTQEYLIKEVNAALKMQHTPRVDNKIREALSQEIKSKNNQSFKTPKWGKTFEPAIQHIVDTFNQELTSGDRNRPLTKQYELALKTMLRHQAQLKLRARARPQPTFGSKLKPIL